MSTKLTNNFVLETAHFGAISMDSTNSWSVEASSLGWTPGYWPDHITTVRGGSLERVSLSPEKAVYANFNRSVTLTVFND